jgi:hypothetical protein
MPYAVVPCCAAAGLYADLPVLLPGHGLSLLLRHFRGCDVNHRP